MSALIGILLARPKAQEEQRRKRLAEGLQERFQKRQQLRELVRYFGGWEECRQVWEQMQRDEAERQAAASMEPRSSE